jgi:hypothetical protein
VGRENFARLEPQVVVNLLPKLDVAVDLVRYGRWRGFTASARRFG